MSVFLNNADILRIAVQQSACDCNCQPEDFFRSTPVITISQPHPKARKYLKLPFACDLVSYGNQIVAQTTATLEPVIRQFLEQFPPEHCFETPNLYVLNQQLQKYNLQVCFMAEYFLPDVTQLQTHSCAYELRLLKQADFAKLYLPQWSNALCEVRKELDVLGIGAYDHGTLVGLAACSADCEEMYQIGIDVLPDYRRQGIAAALTSHLALEILEQNKVPFYCAAWSNLKSVRNAIKCGFRPSWVELTAREISLIHELNHQIS